MYKTQALEAYKISIILKGMNEKLDYLDKLKNNMGEEMAEMMSEEITKVMDEQREMEQKYAHLVTERGELKGISNKHKLYETKQQILNVAKDLKESTRKLCRQLQDNPDVEGNQRQIKNHKKELVDWSQEVMNELTQLSYQSFANNIAVELSKQSEFEVLRKQEKDLNQKIKKLTEDERKAKDETAKQQHEDNLEIQEKKKLVNETDIEAKLHIQYMERHIEGAQSCQDRLYKKTETSMFEQIEAMRKQLETENLVTSTIKRHLTAKIAELKDLSVKRDQLREKEISDLELEKKQVNDERQRAQEEYDKVKEAIMGDDENRQRLALLEQEKQQKDDEKVKEKMSMDEAARFIQRKWQWFQTVGKFLAKKRKGKKGGKKKKKK